MINDFKYEFDMPVAIKSGGTGRHTYEISPSGIKSQSFGARPFPFCLDRRPVMLYVLDMGRSEGAPRTGKQPKEVIKRFLNDAAESWGKDINTIDPNFIARLGVRA